MTDLADLQHLIVETRAGRGFTTDPVRLLCLLTEEVGEVAAEIKRTWSPNYPAPDVEALAAELADSFVVLSALASAFDVDLETAVRSKFFGSDADRPWASADPPRRPAG